MTNPLCIHGKQSWERCVGCESDLLAGKSNGFTRELPPSKKLGASCLAGGHPRAPNDSRGELELCLRDAFAAGCEATAQRSLVTAAVYAHRETPVVAERLRAAHEPSARHSEATLLADEITAADAETLLAGELMDRVCAFLRASQPPGAIREAAEEVIGAYEHRFETVGGKLMGPIDREIEDLRFVLRTIRDTCGNGDPHGGTRAAEIAAHALLPTLTKEGGQ